MATIPARPIATIKPPPGVPGVAVKTVEVQDGYADKGEPQYVSATEMIARSTCLYGYTGTGKTREVRAIAWYNYLKFGTKTRYVTMDGGGMEPLADLIELGIVEVVNIAGHQDFLTLLRLVSKGHVYYADGSVSDKPDLTGIGLVAVETLSAMCEQIMNYYRRNNVKLAQDVSAKVPVMAKDADIASIAGPQYITAVAQAHYATLRDEVFDTIRNFQALAKYGVMQVVFTSHESSGNEAIGGAKVTKLGIGAAGQAITPLLPQRFADLIHMDTVTVSGKLQFRAYFQPHTDPDINKEWPARLRASGGFTAALSKHPDFKNGYLVLDDANETDVDMREGITKLFKFRDSYTEGSVDKLREFINKRQQTTQTQTQTKS